MSRAAGSVADRRLAEVDHSSARPVPLGSDRRVRIVGREIERSLDESASRVNAGDHPTGDPLREEVADRRRVCRPTWTRDGPR